MRSALVDAGLSAPSDRFDDDALRAAYDHSERNWWVHAGYNDYGTGFRSDTGFRPQVDVTQWNVSGAKVWWADGDGWFNRIGLGGEVDRTATQAGELVREEVESWLNVNLPREAFLYVGAGARNQVFETVEFEQTFVATDFTIRATRDLWLGLAAEHGDWIDFASVLPADRLVLRPQITYNVGRRLELEYRHTYQTLDRDDGRVFEIHAPELRVVQQFNRRAFLRGVFQYVDVERPQDGTESRDLLAQLLFTYKVNAGTALFVGYTDVYDGTELYDLTQSQRTFFTKLSYAWLR